MSRARPLSGRRRWAWLLAIALAGCASEQDRIAAVGAVNRAFQADYEAMLVDQGLRTYPVRRMDAFVALHATLGKLGMRIADQDPELGTLTAEAPAPRPLNAQEWQQTAAADLPRMREIARPHVGMLAELIRFEPEGLEIVIHATVLDAGGGSSEVSLTTRMRETAPPKTNMPRREYPPPTAVRLALDKIWRQFEQELRAAGKLR